MTKIVILGAGLSGLSTGYFLAKLGYRVIILEKENYLGGLSTTFRYKEFLLDLGPHKLFSQLEVIDEIKRLMSGKLHEIPKKSRIRLRGKFYDFPVSFQQILFGLNPIISLRLMMSYCMAFIQGKKNSNYETYLESRFGKTGYLLLFRPYAEKVWGTPEKLSADLAASRVAIPSLFEIIKRLFFGDEGKEVIDAKSFLYPKKGIIELSKSFARAVKKRSGQIIFNAEITEIQLENNKISTIKYKKKNKSFNLSPDILISTIPLKSFTRYIKTTPYSVRRAVKHLKFSDLSIVFIIVNKPRLFSDNWIFFPEQEFSFNRISEQKGFSSHMGPKDKTVLMVEVTRSDILRKPNQEIINRVLRDLHNAHILKKRDVQETFIRRMKEVYPIYDVNYRRNIEEVFSFLDSIKNFYSVGRQGAFSYSGMVDCVDMGLTTANFINSSKSQNSWKKVRQKFYNYQVID
ncbi:FAD-dependent oxidoreductase [Candidatus Woesearchaeota archaeon]|nr:FAD-dependent oxidoreductase [Candidatus Woesearchaeota archaeon]